MSTQHKAKEVKEVCPKCPHSTRPKKSKKSVLNVHTAQGHTAYLVQAVRSWDTAAAAAAAAVVAQQGHLPDCMQLPPDQGRPAVLEAACMELKHTANHRNSNAACLTDNVASTQVTRVF